LPEIRVTEATQPLEDEKEKLSLNLVENYLSNTSIAATLDEDKLTKERQNHKDAQIMQEELYDAMVHRQAKEHYECVQSCLEHLHFGKESFEVSEEENQCGKKAAAREEGQRVFSTSFYGDMKSGYYTGIVDNLALMKEFYPNWTFRLYIDVSEMHNETKEQLCQVSCEVEIFDLCPVNSVVTFGDLSKVFGMTWRFLPVTDPLVSVMVSRDLDSRITHREARAVEDWLTSGLAFHVMRDNPYHTTAILGGMWGARMDTGLRDVLDTAMRKLINNVRSRTLAHDSYLCKQASYGCKELRPFPSRRETGPYNFVGAAGPMEVKSVCPEQCRPPEHQDWTLC